MVLVNGAFGVGKSTVARGLRARIDRSRLYDPERVGYVLRRLPRGFPGSSAACRDRADDAAFARRIDTDGKTVDAIVDEIVALLRSEAP